MAIPRVGAIGFSDTLTVSAVGFVDENYSAVPPSSATLIGVNSTASRGSLLLSGNNTTLTGVNSTASDGAVSAATSTYTAVTKILHGTAEVNKLYHGSTVVDKVYVGSTLIFSSPLTFSFNARTYEENITDFSTSTLTTNLSGGSAGDLAILWERRINGDSAVMPATNLNSGWTSIGTGEANASNEFRHDFSYKIMTSSDISSGSITSGQAEVIQHTVLFFTPSDTITSVNAYGYTFAQTAGTLSDQTQSVTTSGASAPVIVIGTKTTHGGSHTATLGGATYDASFQEQISGNKISDDGSIIGYILQNTTLSDVTTTFTDQGNNQQAATFHLAVA